MTQYSISISNIASEFNAQLTTAQNYVDYEYYYEVAFQRAFSLNSVDATCQSLEDQWDNTVMSDFEFCIANVSELETTATRAINDLLQNAYSTCDANVSNFKIL